MFGNKTKISGGAHIRPSQKPTGRSHPGGWATSEKKKKKNIKDNSQDGRRERFRLNKSLVIFKHNTKKWTDGTDFFE